MKFKVYQAMVLKHYWEHYKVLLTVKSTVPQHGSKLASARLPKAS